MSYKALYSQSKSAQYRARQLPYLRLYIHSIPHPKRFVNYRPMRLVGFSLNCLNYPQGFIGVLGLHQPCS